jgi:hypothetical protein
MPLNAQLGPYGANGGHTNTFSLLANSPAINAGNDALAPTADQRGFGRNGISDIGAFEFNGPPPPTQLVSAVSRKTHGSSGTFDINLALAGTPTVECRSGGMNGNYTVIFTFTNNVAGVGSAAVTTGAGFVSSSETAADARQYVVNLSGITNAQAGHGDVVQCHRQFWLQQQFDPAHARNSDWGHERQQRSHRDRYRPGEVAIRTAGHRFELPRGCHRQRRLDQCVGHRAGEIGLRHAAALGHLRAESRSWLNLPAAATSGACHKVSNARSEW